MARLLVISDDQTTRLFLRNILEGAGHVVSMAKDIGESQKFSPLAVKAILVDLHMPEAQALPPIALLRTGFPHVPVLAIAGEGGRIDFLSVRMMGADDVLRQPLAPPTLLEAVERALQETT